MVIVDHQLHLRVVAVAVCIIVNNLEYVQQLDVLIYIIQNDKGSKSTKITQR
jgi:hypothetical protein